MSASGYPELYDLQDAVLDRVFSEPLGFYLTGGTALSRFHLEHRYSDDLDFFCSDAGAFADAFRIVLSILRAAWTTLDIDVDARDFKRLRLSSGVTSLKLDFIADRIARIGLPVAMGSVRVDTVRNILSNKLCAIVGRDEARDVADLLYIARKRTFVWADILADVGTKQDLQLEDLLYRLTTFPIDALAGVPFVRNEPTSLYKSWLGGILADIERSGENSIAELGSPRL